MAALRLKPIPAAIALLVCGPAAAGVITYTQTNPPSCPTTRCEELGYPVPLPQPSLTPVDGFRSYDSLIAQLQGLAFQSLNVAGQPLGNTLANRQIAAFVVGDEANATTAEGTLAEPSVVVTGTVHAREWAAPEVATALVERLVEQQSDAGLHQYLLENVNLVVAPVLNVDGFLQTQRYPTQALTTEFNGDPPNTPRDGRMRRKNMRDVDEQLDENSDGMFGVDVNRNHSPFWNFGGGSSGNTRSLVYHGTGPGSENEAQALYAAAQLAGPARLRLYVDLHSFSRAFFAAYTNNARRNALQDQVAERMRAVTGNRYCYKGGGTCAGNPTAPNFGIGASDEHFANTYQIPAFTLEIEPDANSGATEYGGFGVSHDGFVLPAAEIDRVRGELTETLLLGTYRQAGPPALIGATITEPQSSFGYSAQWQAASASARTKSANATGALLNDRSYQLWLSFNKPMRVRDGGGQVVAYRGQTAPLAPTITLEIVGAGGQAQTVSVPAPLSGWRSAAGGSPNGRLRYADDAFVTSFTVPAAIPLAGARSVTLVVDVQDLSGQKLDANAGTVTDWSDGAWTRYEDAANVAGDVGGADRSHGLLGTVPPPPPPPPPPQSSGGGGGSHSWLALLGLAAIRFLRKRRVQAGGLKS